MTKSRSPKAPKQARSRVLVDAVVEATTRIVRDEGWRRAKVARIAKVAGVSVGSLYRYFPGRDLIISAVIDRALDRDGQASAEALRAMRGPTLRDSVHAYVDALVNHHRVTDPELLGQLVDLLESAGRLGKVHTTFDEMCEAFCQRLLVLHPKLDPTRTRKGAHMAFWGLRGAFIARLRVETPFDYLAFQRDVRAILDRLLDVDAGFIGQSAQEALDAKVPSSDT